MKSGVLILKVLQLQTFTTLIATKQRKTDQKNVIMKADRGLFARLMVVARQRNIEVDGLLQFELGPIPYSLATVFGTLQKTSKAAMLKLLTGSECPTIPKLPEKFACVIDLMALIQSQKNPQTFGRLAENILESVTSIKAKRIDLVCDRYPDNSNFERESRAVGGVLTTKIASADQTIKQFVKFLKHGPNKESLTTYLFEEWQKPKYADLIGNHRLYVTHQGECHSFTQTRGKIRVLLVPSLCTNQEEADTRMFLHFNDIASESNTALLKVEDTDVLSNALYYQWKVNCNIIIERRAGGKVQLVDIKALSRTIGEDVCQALPGYHALTGCDRTSAFSGRGKKTGYDIITSNEDMCQVIAMLGNAKEVSEDLQSNIETFVCLMYGYESDDINAVRVDMFTAPMSKNKPPPESQNLPPTADALIKHVQRANYQSLVWKTALDSEQDLPELKDSGWYFKEGKLELDWMENDPAPVAVMELISCGCKQDCKTRRCSCKKAGLSCTDACKCSEAYANMTERPTADESYER